MTVTQADEQLLSDILIAGEFWPGNENARQMVQIFAKHRQAFIAPYVEREAKLVEALREARKQIRHAGMCHTSGSPGYQRHRCRYGSCSCGARDAIAQIYALLENG